MDKQRNRLYEGMFIISSNLSEDARKNALLKITSIIENRNGKINKIHDMEKRRLAYEINKKREGYYYLIYFTLSSKYLLEIQKEYLLHEDLIRSGIFKADQVLESLEFKPLMQA